MSAEKALIAAVQRGDVAGVAAALAAGHSDKAWSWGMSDAAHVACLHGRFDCLRLLLAAGADPNTVSYKGATSSWSLLPIHKAAQAGHLACVAALLDAGADPCARCDDGTTALHLGVGNVKVARLLLAAAPQAASMPDSLGHTPLHLGVGNAEVVRLLLAVAPQAASMPDSLGRTPQHLGVGNAEVVCLLLAVAPQAATMRDHSNSTPLDAAIEAASGDSAQLLLAEADLQPADEITDRLITTLVYPDRTGQQDRLRRLASVVPVFLARLGLSLDAGDDSYTFQRYRSHMVNSKLARWLPGMLCRSDAAAAQLVRFLPPPDRERLRTLALSLVRYQRSLSARLPAPIAGRLLALAAAQHAQHAQQTPIKFIMNATHRAKFAKGLALHVFFVLLAVAVMCLMRTGWPPKP